MLLWRIADSWEGGAVTKKPACLWIWNFDFRVVVRKIAGILDVVEEKMFLEVH